MKGALVLFAQAVEALLHFGAQVVFNPGVCCFEAFRFEDAANLGFHACGVAGEAQEVIAGEFDEEFAVYLPAKGKNPLSHIESQNGVSHPCLGADNGVEIGR